MCAHGLELCVLLTSLGRLTPILLLALWNHLRNDEHKYGARSYLGCASKILSYADQSPFPAVPSPAPSSKTHQHMMSASALPRYEVQSASSPSKSDVSIFSPKPDHLADFSFDDVPTYLFRLQAPESFGRTTTTEVTAPASMDGDAQKDIFELPPEEAARQLEIHLWWKKVHRHYCNLMSWTSSLLFAVHYGFYRYSHDYDKPTLSDIKILMLDTRQFPEGTFLRDLDAMKHFEEHSKGPKDLKKLIGYRALASSFVYGEYLSQGRLKVEGRCSQMSLQQLIDDGLFEIVPTLKDEKWWDTLETTLTPLRETINAPHLHIAKDTIDQAITTARACVEGILVLPFAVMLLALRGSNVDHRMICDAFQAVFDGKLHNSSSYQRHSRTTADTLMQAMNSS